MPGPCAQRDDAAGPRLLLEPRDRVRLVERRMRE
jgi:hypothetical protein